MYASSCQKFKLDPTLAKFEKLDFVFFLNFEYILINWNEMIFHWILNYKFNSLKISLNWNFEFFFIANKSLTIELFLFIIQWISNINFRLKNFSKLTDKLNVSLCLKQNNTFKVILFLYYDLLKVLLKIKIFIWLIK